MLYRGNLHSQNGRVRLRQVESKFCDLVFHSAPARFAKLLLQFGESMGERDQDTIRRNVRLTHQNLANLMGPHEKRSAPYSVNFNAKDYSSKIVDRFV